MKKTDKIKKLNVKSIVVLSFFVLALSGLSYYLLSINQPNAPSKDIYQTPPNSSSKTGRNEPEPADPTQPPSSETAKPGELIGPPIVPKTNIDNFIENPSKGPSPQLINLRNALKVQNDIYMIKLRAMEAEMDPAAKAMMQRELKMIEQRINEIQKEIDKIEKPEP